MTLEGFVTSCELWLRLAMFILGPLRNALLNVLHNNGVPKQPKHLYNFLNSKKSVLAQLKGKGVIAHPQWKLLFPDGKNETDSNLFDITLIVLLIEALTSIKPSDGNWRNNPPDEDISVGAFCIRGKNMRNDLNHFPDITALTNFDFLAAWYKVIFIITGLKYNSSFDVNYLKTVSLNLKDNLLLQALIASNQTRLDHHNTKINELKNTYTSFEYQTNLSFTTLNEEIEGMRCELVRNTNQTENLEDEIEQLHMSITHDMACLNAKVEELSDRVKDLESENLPDRMEELECQNLPVRVEELETQNLPDRVEQLEIQSQYNGNAILEIAVQLSASRRAVQDEKLESFLEEAGLHCLDSKMNTKIIKVINESVTNILGLDKVDVRVHKLQEISRGGEYKTFQVEINIDSSKPGVFDDYIDSRKPKSNVLKNKIKDSFIKEVKISELIFAFSYWKTGSLHIVFSVRKSNHCTLSELELKLLRKAIDGVLKSEHEYLEDEFGKSVEVITKACTSSNVIDTFNCNIEVVMSTGDNPVSDELLSQLNKKIKTMLIENFNLKRNVEVTTPLATMLQTTENQLERISSTSSDVCDIAKIGTIDAFIAKYLPWFVLAIDVTRVPEIDYNKLVIDKITSKTFCTRENFPLKEKENMAAHIAQEKFDKRKVTNFFVGLEDEDELVFEKKKNNLCGIKSSTPSLENEIRFENIGHLKEQLLTALQKAKESMVDGDTCSLSTRIMDEPFWDIEAGSYKCSEIARKQIHLHNSEGIVGKMKRNYQTTPETKNQLAVEIGIDGAKDTLSYRTFTDDDKDYAFIDVGHGYFLYPDKQYTSFIIVDPGKKNAIMVLLAIHSAADPEYESLVRKHDEKLKECLQKYSFLYPEKILLPKGYSLLKQLTRRNLISILSDETEMLIQEIKISGSHDRAKLHFVDKKLVSKMNEKEWKEEDVTTMIEESLLQIDSLLTNVAPFK